jgi:acetyltransferase-like isoleucine patch superfamily enzyme
MPRPSITNLLSNFRALRLRLSGVEVGPRCVFAARVNCLAGLGAGVTGRIVVGERCQIEQGVILHAHGGEIALGQNVFLGPYAVIYGHGGVTIGDDTLISMHCRILSSNHTVPPLDRHIRWEPDVLRPTHIGRDVWLGAGVTVLGGVTIGDGCVVGAGAVVTKDLPPGSIARGVPAIVYGSRPASA